MSEKPHSELQQHHYDAVRNNPAYRQMGLTEVMFDDMMMEMPYAYIPEQVQEADKDIDLPNRAVLKELSQLKGRTLYLQAKVNEHVDKSKAKRHSKYT